MLRQECREKIIAKLIGARHELEDALKVATPVARYDANVLSESMRTKLASIVKDLKSVLAHLEGTQ